MAGETDLTMLMRLAEQGLAETRAMRAELRDVRTVALGLVDQGRRIERRLNELRDEVELTIKGEIMGRTAHVETQAEARETAALTDVLRQVESLIAERTAPLAERIAVLEKH